MVATIVAIGDELLSGYTLDTNSNWIAQRLRALGIPLKRTTQVRDREGEIVEQVRRDLADPEITTVFCTGGLGPTPDDRTFAALGVALGRELVIEEAVRQRIELRLARMVEAKLIESAELTEGHLRMARIPAAPLAVLRNRVGTAPGVVYEVDGTRLFVLPGVPPEMKSIFTEEVEVAYLAGGSAATVRELHLQFAVEGRFWPVLKELEETHPDVAVGSYPNFESKELVLRCTGADPTRVEEAAASLKRFAVSLGYPVN
ncbi:MAG: competence/damage-inducible protein A [Candidatus Dormibacteraeota bacterium]|nr:competence/damage-inducible protein A [Candidatus Dormibacteraeota bacterium]